MNRSQRRAARHHGKPNAAGGPQHHLPPRLMGAFDRRARDDLSPPKTPAWGRTVRLAVDYALGITIGSIETDRQADDVAELCMMLGALRELDPDGDPPATVAAQQIAGAAGSQHRHAFELLAMIRDCSASWARHGWATPALPAASMATLQRAARGERVPPSADLDAVLEAADNLACELGYPLLRTPPAPAPP